MDENTVETDDNVINVEVTLPSVKEQLISAGIGIGVTIGAYAVLAGGAVLYTKAAEKISAVKERRRLKKIEALEGKLEQLEDEE